MSQRTTIEQPEGYSTIHIWQHDAGDVWACCAADHGPMCRLCQRVDQVLADLLEQCSDGNMLARADSEGGFMFKLTEKGGALAEDLIHNDPEHAALWADLQRNHGAISDAVGADTERGQRPKLSPVEKEVLGAIAAAGGETTPAELCEATGYTRGQVAAALATLAAVGFIG